MHVNGYFLSGIIGVMLFAIASVLGGFQLENYSLVSQYISESMAIDTPYGKQLRYFGYIPAGILISIFAIGCLKIFRESPQVKTGFYGIGLFYGIATVVVGLFPCDAGRNAEWIDPSISQIIHNFTGLLTYLFVPVSILMIGVGLHKLKGYRVLANLSLLCGISSIAFVSILILDPLTNYAGLYQRIIESIFIFWIVVVAFEIKKQGNKEIHSPKIFR